MTLPFRHVRMTVDMETDDGHGFDEDVVIDTLVQHVRSGGPRLFATLSTHPDEVVAAVERAARDHDALGDLSGSCLKVEITIELSVRITMPATTMGSYDPLLRVAADGGGRRGDSTCAATATSDGITLAVAHTANIVTAGTRSRSHNCASTITNVFGRNATTICINATARRIHQEVAPHDVTLARPSLSIARAGVPTMASIDERICQEVASREVMLASSSLPIARADAPPMASIDEHTRPSLSTAQAGAPPMALTDERVVCADVSGGLESIPIAAYVLAL